MRLKSLPESLRREIKDARRARGWSQLALGKKAGLAQRHISGIETGKIVSRYDTLIEVLRALDLELAVVPRDFLPVVQALIREHRSGADGGERPLYETDDDEDDI
ncbi:MAG: helix-turn-helix transcriptional regulator [Rhodospirillales bacterium]